MPFSLASWFHRRQPAPQPAPQPLVLSITIVLEREDDGSYHAYCPALKGLHVDGQNEVEALDRAKDAIELYLESLARHGDHLPVGPHCTLEREREAVYEVPPGASLRHLELPWPSPHTSGIS